MNYGFWNPDDSCTDDPGKNCTVAEKRKNADGFFSDKIPGKLGGNIATYACQLSATVDGVPVQDAGYPIVRTQSPVFAIDDDFYGSPVNDPKTISDGYWVAVPPLGAGVHIIKFKGGLCLFADSPQAIADGSADPLFVVNVTFHLTIAGDRQP